MADIFDELVGSGAPPQELVAALRRQRALGQLGALSGDKNISRLGGSVYDDSMKSAVDLRDRRDRETSRAENQAFQRWQQNQADLNRKEQRDFQYASLRQARELAEAQMRNAREIAGLQAAARGAASGAQAQKTRDQQLNKFEAALRTSGIGNVWSALQGAREVVDKYTDKDQQGNVVGYRGVPGVGGLANVRTMGLGTAAQIGDTEGKENQAKIAALQNLVLQARSGAAVTDPELQRMLAETGLTMFSSDEDFLRAFPRLAAAAEQSVRNTAAGYDPEIVDEFVRRGGLPGFKTGRARNKDAELESLLYGDEE